jgi:hypothetical protein
MALVYRRSAPLQPCRIPIFRNVGARNASNSATLQQRKKRRSKKLYSRTTRGNSETKQKRQRSKPRMGLFPRCMYARATDYPKASAVAVHHYLTLNGGACLLRRSRVVIVYSSDILNVYRESLMKNYVTFYIMTMDDTGEAMFYTSNPQ